VNWKPATTGSAESTFVSERSADVVTAVCVVFDVLLPGVSVVPVEATAAEFVRSVPFGVEADSLTWIVNACDALAARPVVFVHVTIWPAAEQAELDPYVWNVRNGDSVSVTTNPPVLSDGPVFVTVSE